MPVEKTTRSRSDAVGEAEATSRERPEISGGPRLQLSVPGTIPGYHLFWENDEDGKIEQLLDEGFSFVLPEEVRMKRHDSTRIVGDSDISSRISKFVGGARDGSPLRAYLMKCTDELWAEREQSRYAQADAWDAGIRRSHEAPAAGLYNPKGVNVVNDTRYSKRY